MKGGGTGKEPKRALYGQFVYGFASFSTLHPVFMKVLENKILAVYELHIYNPLKSCMYSLNGVHSTFFLNTMLASFENLYKTMGSNRLLNPRSFLWNESKVPFNTN